MPEKKRFWSILYIVITGILMLGCIGMAINSVSSQTFTGTQQFAEAVAERRTIYEQLPLAPGVYEVCLAYDTDTDYSAHCTVVGDVVHQRLLRTNGEHCYQGLSRTKFYLWLLEPTNNLQVVVDYSGNGALKTGALTIRNTGKLWTIGMVGILVASILLGIVLRCKALRTKQNLGILLCLVLITLVASMSQLGESMLGGADLTYHLQRIEGVKDSILSGQFPIRIEPEWLYGHGYANGIFYCDILFYLPALLRLAGFPIGIAYNIFCICLNLATAWIAFYCFGKIFRSKPIGLMCSALYTLSIIRLYKLAIVGAVGEGSAITFLPLIFYGMYRVFTEDENKDVYKTAWLPLTFGYAGLMQTHVLTCEITAFLTVLICLIGIRRVIRPRVFIELCKGALGALGLSLWYLVPFLDYFATQNMHIRHVSGRTIQNRGLYLAQLFMDGWSAQAKEALEAKGYFGIEPISPGIVCMCGLIVFLMLWLAGMFRKAKMPMDQPECKALSLASKLSAVFACMLLAMTLQCFPWDAIHALGGVVESLVSSLQFPNRFLGWAMVFLIMLFGTCLWRFKRYRITLVLGLILTLFSALGSSAYMMKNAINDNNHLYLYNEAGMGFGYISGAEYLVEGTSEELLTFAGPDMGEEIELLTYDKKYLQINASCENHSDKESYIDFPLLLYKGYRANGASGEKLNVVDGPNHLVRVMIPGNYKNVVNVRFVSPVYWRLSELVTLGTYVVFVYYFGKKRSIKEATYEKCEDQAGEAGL